MQGFPGQILSNEKRYKKFLQDKRPKVKDTDKYWRDIEKFVDFLLD